jgi:hypothetical protein
VLVLVPAIITLTLQPAFVASINCKQETYSRIPVVTLRAVLIGDRHVDHDVFLSSYSMLSSADGGISRRSGISLADDTLFYRKIAVIASRG